MAKVQIEEKKMVSGPFKPVTIGENIDLSMKYTVEGEKKSFFGIAKVEEKEVSRCNWMPGSRLYINVENDVEADKAVEIVDTFVEGLKMVIAM